jgi:ectoine hydroxylase-related dioxygenase (phytanoyl-CoA dioxygenase family)
MAMPLTAELISAYHEDGYLFLPGFFDREMIAHVRVNAREDAVLDDASFGRSDGEGGTVRLSLWNHPTDTIYGAIARSSSLVGAIEQLLGEEVYHYHSKMIMKDARTGGAWAWHQDYGYWYQNGALRPDLCSAFIAIDPCTLENGCLQVIRGSHHLGRLDHQATGEQAAIDPERLEAIRQRLETRHVLMEPGDLLLFHPNTLHRSDQNTSDHPRWSMICCYNAASNSPYKESHHPGYTRLHRIKDEDIMHYAGRRFSQSDRDSLMTAEADRSVEALQGVTR